jgi:hypothetical protein
MVEGLPMLKNEYVACEGCALGKMHKDEFPSNFDRRKIDVLELVHTDVCGPMQTRSLGGAYYFLLFIDDCTRYTWVYFLRERMMFLNTLRNLETWWRSKHERP